MTCDRCEEIHIAQRSGLSGKPCECGCHHTHSYNGYIPTWSIGTTVTTCDGTGCSTLNFNSDE